MKRQLRVTVARTDTGWTAGWVVFIDTNGNRRWDDGEPLLARHRALAASTTLVSDTTPGYVAFAGQGRPVQYTGAFLAGTIGLCDAHISKNVVVAKSGRPRV